MMNTEGSKVTVNQARILRVLREGGYLVRRDYGHELYNAQKKHVSTPKTSSLLSLAKAGLVWRKDVYRDFELTNLGLSYPLPGHRRNKPAKETVAQRAQRLSKETAESLSFSRYGETEWTQLIVLLIRRRMTDKEITALLFSRVTRWAADCANRIEGCGKAQDVIAFINDPKMFKGKTAFRKVLAVLVSEHFTGGTNANPKN